MRASADSGNAARHTGVGIEPGMEAREGAGERVHGAGRGGGQVARWSAAGRLPVHGCTERLQGEAEGVVATTPEVGAAGDM